MLKGLRNNIPKLYAFKFFATMHLFAGVLVPFFTEWGNISFTQVMLLQSWFTVWIFILEVPTGAVADHWGRKASLILGAAALVAAVRVYLIEPSFVYFLAAEWLWALSSALVSGADHAIVWDSLKASGLERSSKKILGRFTSFETAAIFVAAPLGSVLAQRFDITTPLRVEVIPFFIALLIAWTIEEPPRSGPKKEMDYLERIKDGMRYFRGHPSLVPLACDFVVPYVLSFMMLWLFQPFLQSIGVPIGWFGFVVAGSTAMQILIMNHFDEIERWLGGGRRVLFWTSLIPGLAYLALVGAEAFWVAIPFVVMTTGVGMSRRSLLSNYMNKHIDSERRATVLSTVNMFRQLGSAIVYPLVGLLQEESARSAFFLLGGALVLWSWLSPVREEHLLD